MPRRCSIALFQGILAIGNACNGYPSFFQICCGEVAKRNVSGWTYWGPSCDECWLPGRVKYTLAPRSDDLHVVAVHYHIHRDGIDTH
jgi:hypothetical protein